MSQGRNAVVEELSLPERILLGDTLAQNSSDSLNEREFVDLRSDILDSLPANVALLDAEGTIVAINRSWRKFALDNGFDDPSQGIGSNYLAACDRAFGEAALPAMRATEGIRSVLRGSVPSFSMEYVLEIPSGDRWFLLIASPIGSGRPTGATVLHLDITARKHDESNLWRFVAAMDSLSDGVVMIDRARMAVTYVNDAACRLQGLSRALLLQLKPWEPLGTSRAELEQKYDRILAQGGTDEPQEILWRRSDESQLWIEVRRHAHCLDGAVYVVILTRDISARKIAESRIQYLSRVHAILSGINTLIVRVNTREELFREACRVAVEKGEFPVCWIGVIDRRTRKLVPAASAGEAPPYMATLEDRMLHSSAEAMERSYMMRAIRDKRIQVCNDSRSDEYALAGDQHEAHGIRSFVMLPLMVADEAVGVMALYAAETDFFHDEEVRLLTELADDVSFAIDHLEKQDRLDYCAFYDSVTDLPNRNLFLDRLAQFVRNAEGVGRPFAVCVVDIERFRNFNDSLGRVCGDSLLRQVAEWLVSHLGDIMLLGRLDSDRFAVVLSEIESEAGAAVAVENLINSFAAHSFRVNGEAYRLALKVGVSRFPDDGADANVLFQNAGAALTKAKSCRDPYLFFAQRMTETVAGRLGMEYQLRLALERDEFLIHYQPKIDLATGQMVGAEALLRWNDPATGLVEPSRFIPLLEETGLIFDVGRWVLGTVIKDHIEWRRAEFRSVRIAVNVSPLQLRHASFVADIQRLVGTDERVSAGLELEITESLIMEDVNRSVTALQAIRELGITVAIDDFGTGYSSLSQLAKLPVDTLKIDRSFISDMTAKPSGRSLVSTIINLAHSFNLKVVAEGVETADQERILRMLTCDEAQGYLYSKALPARSFSDTFLQPAVG